MENKINIGDLFVKQDWYRRQTADSISNDLGAIISSSNMGNGQRVVKVKKTQEDFLCEIDPSTHKIMSHKFLAPRPIWEKKKDNEGKEYLAIVGYEDVSRISLGLHHDIILKKVAHYAGSGISIFNESLDKKSDETYNTLLSKYDVSGIDVAYMDIIWSLFHTCDAAIYLYVDAGEIKWKVFSYLNGDKLYPHIDENGDQVIVRHFSYHNKDAVEIYNKNSVEFWVKEDDEEDSSWWNKFVKFLAKDKKAQKRLSEDGYRQVYNKAIKAIRNHCIYFRIDDIPTAKGQILLDSLERVLSGLSEENKYYAYQMLFLKSSGIKELPMVGSNGKIFLGAGENDDMKSIVPADSSNTVTIEINELKQNIDFATANVSITPDLLKGGDFSAAALEQLYYPQIQWCKTTHPKLYNSTKDMIMVFKELVGIVERKSFEFQTLDVSIVQNIWTPKNESETVDNTTKKVYAGILSRKGAMQITNDNIRDDYNTIKEEMEFKATLGVEDTNPDSPNIDNNDINKDIADTTGS